MIKIKRALVSVSDKTGIVELGAVLKKYGVQILSTGGTAKALAADQDAVNFRPFGVTLDVGGFNAPAIKNRRRITDQLAQFADDSGDIFRLGIFAGADRPNRLISD